MGTRVQNIKISYNIIGKIEDLQEIEKRLLDTALKATEKAYAPYSDSKVGAAILLEGGLIISGSNQENASYPLGLCAERVAIFTASAEFPGRIIEKIVVVSKDNRGQLKPITPCGGCRQVLYEYEFKQGKPIVFLMVGSKDNFLEFKSISSLLPFPFHR